MPFAGIQDLPAEVASTLSPSSAPLFLRVANSSIAAGEEEPTAIENAFQGLANAGYSKANDGKFYQLRKIRFSKRRDGGAGFAIPITVDKSTIRKDASGTLTFAGWSYMSADDDGLILVDHDGHSVEALELEQAAANFVKRGGGLDLMHEGPLRGQLVGSLVFTPKKRLAMGLDGTGPIGWWTEWQTKDEALIDGIESGEISELSIEGRANLVPMEAA